MKTTKTTPNNSNKPFKHYNEFAKVITDGRIYHFGRIQAKVISQLYAASFTNSPWLFGKDILYKAGSHTTRVSDLFKSYHGIHFKFTMTHRHRFWSSGNVGCTCRRR
jgi:hypothetical protein